MQTLKGNQAGFNEFGLTGNSGKKKKIRNYEKIVTNPLFKHLDIESCGSAYFKDWDVNNDEMDIRDMIKKVE